MRYRSEIRDSQIRNLRQKVDDRDYGKYLLSMTLQKLRVFNDATIFFRFPITALIGPNGSGKSTVLGAAALLYEDTKPSTFFAESSADRDTMQGIRITYRAIDRDKRRDGEVERVVSRTKKWNRDALTRRVLFFGFRRAIPANERSEFTKYRTGVKDLDEENYAVLSDDVLEAATKILSLDLRRYTRSRSEAALQGRRVSPLIGYAGENKFSEFHFGAGVSVIIELVWNLENLDPKDQALVLIEELENTLHPLAVRRLVEYLITVAARKRCQIIFTTHSEYALDPLPREAIWAAREGQLINGRLRVEDTLAFRGDVDTRLVVFCEDITARDWLMEMLRQADQGSLLNSIEFYPVGSYTDVSAKTKQHNENPSRRFAAVGFVDGDTPSDYPLAENVYRLPGNHSPEEVIFETVQANYHVNLAVLAVRLLGQTSRQEQVRRIIDEVVMQTRDSHLLFSILGERLGFLPEETARLAMMSAFCMSTPDSVEGIVQHILRNYPQNGDSHL